MEDDSELESESEIGLSSSLISVFTGIGKFMTSAGMSWSVVWSPKVCAGRVCHG